MLMEQMIRLALQGIESCADNQHVDLVQLLQGLADWDGYFIAGHDLGTIDRDQLPIENIALTHSIG